MQFTLVTRLDAYGQRDLFPRFSQKFRSNFLRKLARVLTKEPKSGFFGTPPKKSLRWTRLKEKKGTESIDKDIKFEGALIKLIDRLLLCKNKTCRGLLSLWIVTDIFTGMSIELWKVNFFFFFFWLEQTISLYEVQRRISAKKNYEQKLRKFFFIEI